MKLNRRALSGDNVVAWAVQGKDGDQTFTGGNAALVCSMEQGMPVRMVRKRQ